MKQPSEYLPVEFEQPQPPEAVPIRAKRLFDLQRHEANSDDTLLGNRYLCRGGGLLLAAPTGIGKSTIVMQMTISFALGHDCFGITPARSLTSLVIQAENDEGDIAEMRDGVAHGLRLTPGQIEAAKERTHVHTEDSKTGLQLVALADELLEAHKPDLLVLDPALSYLGGDTNSQKDVGGFLRNLLNPVIHRHRCGCIVVHHTNKPARGEEKSTWQAGDFAYIGSGSAEWANWARAVLAIRSIGSHNIYELRAGKRGARLGWRDNEGNPSFSRYIGHSNDPRFIYWRDADESEVSKGGRPKENNAEAMLRLLPPSGLTTTEWQEAAYTECGISRRSFYREKAGLETAGKIIKSKVNDRWQPTRKQ